MSSLLLIEDHSIVREGLRRILQEDDRLGQVTAAASGKEAIRLLDDGLRPDILLTDLHLGDMSGIDLINRARREDPEIRGILLTMETDERYLFQAFCSGASGYILKETDADELLFGLERIAQGHVFVCTGMTKRLSQHWTIGYGIQQHKKTDVELSSRETEVLALIADGYTNLEIADKLFTSRRTVEGHRLQLLQKTGVRNTPELIKFAMIHGLISGAA